MRYILIAVCLIAIAMTFLLRPKPKLPPQTELPPQPSGKFLFIDDYEENPIITKTTHELWMKVIDDTKKGNYWSDQEHRLEIGKTNNKGQYKIDPLFGGATVTTNITHGGIRSVEITASEAPPEHKNCFVALAHYIRNQSLIRDGIYELGAWFYVPEGNNPIVLIGMENHPSWLIQDFAYAGVDTENGNIGAWVNGAKPDFKPISKVNFQHNKWFKLWITFHTGEKKFEVGYSSPGEEKTLEVDGIWTSYANMAYIGYKAFNFYTGVVNTSGRAEQKLYVDDFYAKAVD